MKKWWGIRHLRWAFLSHQVWEHAHRCYLYGLGLGIPHEADLRYLDEIWKGRA